MFAWCKYKLSLLSSSLDREKNILEAQTCARVHHMLGLWPKALSTLHMREMRDILATHLAIREKREWGEDWKKKLAVDQKKLPPRVQIHQFVS
jgi:hypothetical protein